MNVPNTRINSLESIENALKVLTSQGYETTALWAEHNAWLLSVDVRSCTDEDRQWAAQLPEPSTTEEHFINGEPEPLTAARCHVGRQYTLTDGQKAVLRDRHGLTPTAVIVAKNVELFDSDDVIWSLTLKSTDLIAYYSKRTRVLNEVVICPASAFFRDAALKDKEREKERKERGETVSKPKSLAMEYVSVP